MFSFCFYVSFYFFVFTRLIKLKYNGVFIKAIKPYKTIYKSITIGDDKWAPTPSTANVVMRVSVSSRGDQIFLLASKDMWNFVALTKFNEILKPRREGLFYPWSVELDKNLNVKQAAAFERNKD